MAIIFYTMSGEKNKIFDVFQEKFDTRGRKMILNVE
jgi:hypothetical protein